MNFVMAIASDTYLLLNGKRSAIISKHVPEIPTEVWQTIARGILWAVMVLVG